MMTVTSSNSGSSAFSGEPSCHSGSALLFNRSHGEYTTTMMELEEIGEFAAPTSMTSCMEYGRDDNGYSLRPSTATNTSSTSSTSTTTINSENPSSDPATNNNNTGIHTYQDHQNDPIYVDPTANTEDPPQADDTTTESTTVKPTSKTTNKGTKQRGAVRQFPSKLYEMLTMSCDSNQPGGSFENLVGWQPHGRAFLVRDPKRFVATIMPRFFSQTKLTSFQRQLALYGFVRITRKDHPDRGAYYHELFLRGRPDLISRLFRTRVKGTGCKAPASPETEPNFYRMPTCGASSSFHPSYAASPQASPTSSPYASPNCPPLTTSTSVLTLVSSEDQSMGGTVVTDEEMMPGSSNCDETASNTSGSSPSSSYHHPHYYYYQRRLSDDYNDTPSQEDGVLSTSLEFELPASFQAVAHPPRRPSGTAAISIDQVGPLHVPGRLRQAVIVQPQEPRAVASLDLIKFVPLDLSHRAEHQKEQRHRWVQPLELHDIASGLVTANGQEDSDAGVAVGTQSNDQRPQDNNEEDMDKSFNALNNSWLQGEDLNATIDSIISASNEGGDWASHLLGPTNAPKVDVPTNTNQPQPLPATSTSSSAPQSSVEAGMMSLLSDDGCHKFQDSFYLGEGEPASLQDLLDMF